MRLLAGDWGARACGFRNAEATSRRPAQAGATRSNRVGVLVWNSQIFRVRENAGHAVQNSNPQSGVRGRVESDFFEHGFLSYATRTAQRDILGAIMGLVSL